MEAKVQFARKIDHQNQSFLIHFYAAISFFNPSSFIMIHLYNRVRSELDSLFFISDFSAVDTRLLQYTTHF